jgi:hypothetical protein
VILLFKIGGKQTQSYQENKYRRQSKLEINGRDDGVHNVYVLDD